MDIVIRYFDGCPNWRVAEDRVRTAVRELGLREDVSFERIQTPEEAERARFLGSPTILIDGRDPFPGSETTYGLACRTYPTKDGPQGSPTTDDVRAALEKARA